MILKMKKKYINFIKYIFIEYTLIIDILKKNI